MPDLGSVAGLAQAAETKAKGSILGLFQIIKGGIGAKKDNKRLNALQQEREDNPYITPKQVYDAVNATAYDAQSGLGDQTINYLTNEAGRGFASSIDALSRLGGDPNQIAALNDNYMNDIFKIGSDNSLAQFNKFNNYLNSTYKLADSLDAEFLYKDNLRKDKLQAASASLTANQNTLNSGINMLVGSGAAAGTQAAWSGTLNPNVQQQQTPQFLAQQSSRVGGDLPVLGTTTGLPTGMRLSQFLNYGIPYNSNFGG